MVGVLVGSAPDLTTPTPEDVDDHTAEDESKRRSFNR